MTKRRFRVLAGGKTVGGKTVGGKFRQAGEKAEQDNLTRTVFLAAVCRDLSQAV
jgi:hypothetical protein